MSISFRSTTHGNWFISPSLMIHANTHLKSADEVELSLMQYFFKARFHFTKNQYADLMLIMGIAGTVSQACLSWVCSATHNFFFYYYTALLVIIHPVIHPYLYWLDYLSPADDFHALVGSCYKRGEVAFYSALRRIFKRKHFISLCYVLLWASVRWCWRDSKSWEPDGDHSGVLQMLMNSIAWSIWVSPFIYSGKLLTDFYSFSWI